MKRGFLLPPKRPVVTRTPEVNPRPTSEVCDTVISSVEPLDPHNISIGYKAHVAPLSSFDRSSLPAAKALCTRIPPSPIDSFGSSECVITTRTMARLYNNPKFPCSPPDVPLSKVYERRAAELNMGGGLFALQSLKIGDLILVERPLLLACNDPKLLNGLTNNLPPRTRAVEPLGAFQALLEVPFYRMRKADQEAYLALPNVHKDDPTLVGIWRTNNVMFNHLNLVGEDLKYSAMFREQSWISHSCQPNCSLSFDPASFSIQIRATRPLSIGEEILMCRCDPNISTSERSASLEPFGITCVCSACVYNPSVPRNDTVRTSIPKRLKQLKELSAPLGSTELLLEAHGPGAGPMTSELSEKLRKNHVVALKVKEKATRLMVDIKAEGLDGTLPYFLAVEQRLFAVLDLIYTSQFDQSFDQSLEQSSLRFQWDLEMRDMVVRTVVLHKAIFGSFTKNKVEEFLPLLGVETPT